MQETENGSNKDLNGCTKVPDRRPSCSSFSHQIRIEATDGAYLAYTRRRTREPKSGKGGGERPGEEHTVGGRKRRSGEEKPRGGTPFKDNARSCSRHPPCLIPTGRWPESRRPEPGGAGPLGRMCSPPDELNVLPRRARQRDTKLHRAVRDPPEPP